MCYPKPGPRCSAHAAQAVKKAEKAYEADPANYDRYERLQVAKEEWLQTPAGIKHLLDNNKLQEAEVNLLRRQRRIWAVKEQGAG